MTPYYDEDGVTIYHGDCREVVPSISLVDQVLTSPPYNLGMRKKGRSMEWRALADGYDGHHDDMPHSDYVAWQQDVLRLCWDRLSESGAIYYQHKPVAKGNDIRLPFELNPGLPLRQIVTWDRGSGFMRQFTHYVPRYEWILVFAKPAFRITTRNVDDVWRIPPARGSDHPAPFPLELAAKAVATTSAETILDPFCGSGTTLRAAKDAGRKAVGIDISERYCEMAAKRMSQGALGFEGVA